MDETDPRAVVALAIVSAILKSLSHANGGRRYHPIGYGDVRQAMIICMAMLIEADPALATIDDLHGAAHMTHRELGTQLAFMRDHFHLQGERMWDAMSASSNRWWS